MIYAKVFKHSQIVIYKKDKDGGELESYSLLKISPKELLQLIRNIEFDNDLLIEGNSIILPFKDNKKLYDNFKAIANEHKLKKPNSFLDVSKKFTSNIEGTSVLVRDPIKHLIWIAKRKGNNLQNINRICIDNIVRERFFKDCKTCIYYKENNKFIIDTRDLRVYTTWSDYMNKIYLENVKK